MRRISYLAAAAAVLGYAGLALAQQPAYSPSYQDRYVNRPASGNTVMPAERQSWSPWRQSSSRETRGADTMASGRQRATMNAGQFSTESDARAHCGSDTVVWVNTKSGVYHFAGNRSYGQTKHGAFMCRADADRAGTFRPAKHELQMQGRMDRMDRTSMDRSMMSRFSGSSTNRY